LPGRHHLCDQGRRGPLPDLHRRLRSGRPVRRVRHRCPRDRRLVDRDHGAPVGTPVRRGGRNRYRYVDARGSGRSQFRADRAEGPADAGADHTADVGAGARLMPITVPDLASLLAASSAGPADRLADSALPLALFPVRLETRFFTVDSALELRVRIYPDKVHLDSHDPALTADEVTWGRPYWDPHWHAGADDATLPHP